MALDGAISSKEFDGTVSKRFMAYVIILVAVGVFILSGIFFEFRSGQQWKIAHERESVDAHKSMIKEFRLELDAYSSAQKQDLLTAVELLNQKIERLENQQNYDRDRVSRVVENHTSVLKYRVDLLEQKSK